MTNAKPAHTPGPWVEFAVEGHTVTIMAAMHDPDICSFVSPYPARANAQLMAASPELLAACVALKDATGLRSMQTAYEMACKAIQKATA